MAIAAEVSPRHNGDVRTLKSVIKLLKRKEIVVSKITEFHDKAEIVSIHTFYIKVYYVY